MTADQGCPSMSIALVHMVTTAINTGRICVFSGFVAVFSIKYFQIHRRLMLLGIRVAVALLYIAADGVVQGKMLLQYEQEHPTLSHPNFNA